MSLFDISDSSEDEMIFAQKKLKANANIRFSIDNLLQDRETDTNDDNNMLFSPNTEETEILEDLKGYLNNSIFDVSIFTQNETHYPPLFFQFFPPPGDFSFDRISINHSIHKLVQISPKIVEITPQFLFSILFSFIEEKNSIFEDTLLNLLSCIQPGSIILEQWLSIFNHFAQLHDSYLIYPLLIANPINFETADIRLFYAYFTSLFCSSVTQHPQFFRFLSYFPTLFNLLSVLPFEGEAIHGLSLAAINALSQSHLSIISSIIQIPFHPFIINFLSHFYMCLLDYLFNTHYIDISSDLSSFLNHITQENFLMILSNNSPDTNQNENENQNDNSSGNNNDGNNNHENFLRFSAVLVLIEKSVSIGIFTKSIHNITVKNITNALQLTIKTEDQSNLTGLKEQLHITKINLEMLREEILKNTGNSAPLFNGAQSDDEK